MIVNLIVWSSLRVVTLGFSGDSYRNHRFVAKTNSAKAVRERWQLPLLVSRIECRYFFESSPWK